MPAPPHPGKKSFFVLKKSAILVLSYINITLALAKGSRKKVFFRGPATKRGGGGVRAWPLRKKKTFFEALKKIPPKNMTTKLEEGGGKALVAGPLKKTKFFAASLKLLDLIFLALQYCAGEITASIV